MRYRKTERRQPRANNAVTRVNGWSQRSLFDHELLQGYRKLRRPRAHERRDNKENTND